MKKGDVYADPMLKCMLFYESTEQLEIEGFNPIEVYVFNLNQAKMKDSEKTDFLVYTAIDVRRLKNLNLNVEDIFN